MKFKICPECGDDMEPGFVNAPSVGILWCQDENLKWATIFTKKFEKLQTDWLGPKMTKRNLPAVRCRKCKLVAFQCMDK